MKILKQLVSEKMLSESYVDLNSELEKDAVGTLGTPRALEGKLQDIDEASMRKVTFSSDENRLSLQKKRKLSAMV